MTAFIVSLGLATSPYILSSCSSSRSTVNKIITNDMEFETVLDSVSDANMSDDYLDDLKRYKELSKEGDFEGSQDAIVDFTQNVIMSCVCEFLDAELDEIKYKIYVSSSCLYVRYQIYR